MTWHDAAPTTWPAQETAVPGDTERGGVESFDSEGTSRERWPALPSDPGLAVPVAVTLWAHADRLDAEQRLR
ncbi:MAG: hypothetical protein ACT4PW_05400 [Acidimicrobiia bacterium]